MSYVTKHCSSRDLQADPMLPRKQKEKYPICNISIAKREPTYQPFATELGQTICKSDQNFK
ncbi:14314_t:CDS:2 [Gigaspora margarita]|uniref:14314_t:CDS:1 n=1 Tax=Gigaspora margarita TaxID=4874 RepID=A0ABN7UN99_GIGMA|nr:14314_t:CDS:2 [Gigaspora margarita]